MALARATAAIVVKGPVTYQNAGLPSLGPTDPFAISKDNFNRQGFSQAADRHFDTHWRGLFFEKNADWESEREYRILVRNEVEHDAALFVSIEAALVGVVYGEKIARGHLATIARNLLDTDIQLAEARWQNGIPQITPDNPRALLQRMNVLDNGG
ncbi:hypothetical protein L53_12900 [Hyphomonas sp. L-53-1-40]|nr:hypothetical protein L53_12900 [Hyphomonas sp. L-53-1-40]